MNGNLFENQFRKLLNSDSEYQRKSDKFSDKKSDLIIKHREKLKNLKRKHSIQNQQLKMKQRNQIKLLNQKHSANLQSLYGRTFN